MSQSFWLDSFSIVLHIFIVILQALRIWLKSCIFSVVRFLPKVRKDICNDIILITGGGQGIGRLLALEFAKYRPKQIILWGRGENALQEAVRAVASFGVFCTYMVCDVASDKQVTQQADRLRSQFGDVSIVVNNAGIVCGKPVNDTSMEEMENVIQVNTLGQIRVTKAFLPAMLSSDIGHVVSINSMLGLVGVAGATDYATSKFALSGFMDSLRAELTKSNIKVTSVHPYLVDTGMFDGCTTRFPWLLPALSKEYVASEIVSAVLTNQTELLMPRLMYLALFCKSLLPTEAVMVLYKFLGLNSAMTGFYRRHSTKNE